MTSTLAPGRVPGASAPSPQVVASTEEGLTERASERAPRPSLGGRLDFARAVLVVAALLAGGVVAQLTMLSSVQQRSRQQALYDSFRAELAQGTAATGPLDSTGRALPVGTPVAYLEIPAIGLQQVVLSGTTSAALFSGPGLRRDSVFPGQVGATVVMGRAAAYGGPFARIDELTEDDEVRVTTGQGEFEYHVLGVRHEGDPLPPPPGADDSRLILTTADGSPFLPSGVLRVDAVLEDANAGPGRLFTADALPPAERAMGGDTSQLWALVLWLQVAVAAALGTVWSWKRWGLAQTWVVAVPVLLLVGIALSDHIARLLPNLT